MISSESNAQIKEIVKLQKSAGKRRKKGLFVVEGIKLTKEAADYGKLKMIYVSESFYEKAQEAVLKLLEAHKYEIVSDSVFSSISETVTPQGMLGLVEMPSYTLKEILEDKRHCFMLLDDLRDPGNLGTIMRTAEGANMSGVILSKESVDLFNPKVVRSTMGAIFRVPFFYAEDLADVIDTMKSQDIPVYGTMMQGSVVYDTIDYRSSVGIVIGNEANGISDKVIKHLTGAIRIPMAGSLESLNAAVSAAVLMYEIARQREFL